MSNPKFKLYRDGLKLNEIFIKSVYHISILDKGILYSCWNKVWAKINNALPYFTRMDIDWRFKSKEELCPMLVQALSIQTPNSIKFNISSKIDAGSVKVRPSYAPAIIFIKPNQADDFISVVWKEVNVSWSKAFDIEYYDKNEFLVLNNFTSITLDGITSEKPPSIILKNLKDFANNKKSLFKSEFLIFIQNINDYTLKIITKYIQPSQSITITICNEQQVIDMLDHPDFSDWILKSNYVELIIIGWENESVLLKFLTALNTQRVLSLKFTNKISNKLLLNLEKIVDKYNYLWYLEILLQDKTQLISLLEILDCTK